MDDSWKPQILESEIWPIDKIYPNSYNPNEMDEKTMELTRLSMREEGFSDPIDIDPSGMILDGEHRWRIAKELGITHIPVFIKERYGDDAVITTIRKDRTHGEPDLVKLSTIVGELVDTFGQDEVTRRLGYDENEQRAFMEVTRWDWEAYGTDEEDAHQAAQTEFVTWSCGVNDEIKAQLEVILPKYQQAASVGQYGDTPEGRFIEFIKDVQGRMGEDIDVGETVE